MCDVVIKSLLFTFFPFSSEDKEHFTLVFAIFFFFFFEIYGNSDIKENVPMIIFLNQLCNKVDILVEIANYEIISKTQGNCV